MGAVRMAQFETAHKALERERDDLAYTVTKLQDEVEELR